MFVCLLLFNFMNNHWNTYCGVFWTHFQQPTKQLTMTINAHQIASWTLTNAIWRRTIWDWVWFFWIHRVFDQNSNVWNLFLLWLWFCIETNSIEVKNAMRLKRNESRLNVGNEMIRFYIVTVMRNKWDAARVNRSKEKTKHRSLGYSIQKSTTTDKINSFQEKING